MFPHIRRSQRATRGPASYGPLPSGAHDRLRARFYLARHLLAIVLERHRLGDSELSAIYADAREVLAGLE